MMYSSDKSRFHILLQGTRNATSEAPEFVRFRDTYAGYDALTYVQKTPDGFRYFEGWFDSCWRGLYKKPEYKGLQRAAAIEKFVRERFTVIADAANLKVVDWQYKRTVLRLDLMPRNRAHWLEPRPEKFAKFFNHGLEIMLYDKR